MSMSSEVIRRLGIRHPIIQGPFGGGLSTARLTAAVSNKGGLGSFGAHHLAPDAIAAVASDIESQTSAPYALNLWVSDHDPDGQTIDQAGFDRCAAIFAPYFEELGMAQPQRPAAFHPNFEAQAEAVLELRPPAFSFVFGIPSPTILAECRRRGIVTLGSATTLAEAQKLEAAGVDLVVASGFEAGGHRPSFLRRAEESLTGTFALTRILSTRLTKPVVAAGGIADGAGINAALALGAGAAQLGTAFLACAESAATDAHRAVLFGDGVTDTVLTRAYTGRLARGVRNRLIEELERRAAELPPFPVQAWFVSQLKAAAARAGRSDLTALYAGQAASVLSHRTAAALFDALVLDMAPEGSATWKASPRSTLDPVQSPSNPQPEGVL